MRASSCSSTSKATPSAAASGSGTMLAKDSPIGKSGGLSNTTRQPGARTAMARRKTIPRRPCSVSLCMFEPYAKYHMPRRRTCVAEGTDRCHRCSVTEREKPPMIPRPMASPWRDYAADVILRDGTSVHLRAIRPTDRAELARGFEQLSPEAVYFRFFRAKHRLNDAELTAFTELDFASSAALVAVLRVGGEER